MTFCITGPGMYVNATGDEVEIIKNDYKHAAAYPWRCIEFFYDDNGKVWTQDDCVSTDVDIVGVWDDTELWENGTLGCDARYVKRVSPEEEADMQAAILGSDKSTDVQSPKASEYNLKLASERFRALEDGRSIRYRGIYGTFPEVTPQNVKEYVFRLIDNNLTWSLVPIRRTRTVTTRLWVYTSSYSGDTWTERSEHKNLKYAAECLGAIEGSEQTTEGEI